MIKYFKNFFDELTNYLTLGMVIAFLPLLIVCCSIVHDLFFDSKITEGKVIEKHFIASSYSEVIVPVEGTSLTTNIKRIHIPEKYSIVVKKGSSKETFYVDELTFYKINIGSYFSTNEKLVISK